MTPDQWSTLQNDIATAIDDSMDIDWTADVGARAVVEMLRTYGYEIKPKSFKFGDQVWVDGSDLLWTVIHVHLEGVWLSHTDEKGFTYDQVHDICEIHHKGIDQ